ncbi:DUF2785 domain-containing protein [Rossellomorea vietnamensis]|uniref:DUF2785 domain-containing protein n=1 Tax=Rossellomorea vietnamensis TaxID=218284 RepID=A0A5D4MF78_9BACI|nr:DUF2785 domain-containing protein [Rossellomorea vietnamensis]TYS00312.1 DUF2785 domain-containing protein [Rossellomorea vietnamensis]
MDLKCRLQDFQRNDYQGYHYELVLDEMIENIGHPDPELRDQLIYTTLYRWVEKDVLTDNSLRWLLSVSLDDSHLFYKIGERSTDTVFTRSFSSLSAALIMRKDAEIQRLPKELILAAIDKTIQYLKAERDTRGYVQGKGWAHSIAHGADLLAASIAHPYFQQSQIPACLDAIASCYKKEAVYMDDEDERLIFAVEALLKRGMTEGRLLEWIHSMNENLKGQFEETGYSVPLFKRKKNLLDFLKSLYFRMGNIGEYQEVQNEISTILEQWHKTFYRI